jgi:hypothetical protein
MCGLVSTCEICAFGYGFKRLTNWYLYTKNVCISISNRINMSSEMDGGDDIKGNYNFHL